MIKGIKGTGLNGFNNSKVYSMFGMGENVEGFYYFIFLIERKRKN